MLPLSPILHVLCLFTRPDKRQSQQDPLLGATESSFLADAQKGLRSLLVALGYSVPDDEQKGLLSLLVCNRVFFTSWYVTNLSLLMVYKFPTFKILPWQPNKMATGP